MRGEEEEVALCELCTVYVDYARGSGFARFYTQTATGAFRLLVEDSRARAGFIAAVATRVHAGIGLNESHPFH